MKADEIRERFLSFFERQGHQRVPSSSLIPTNDPTLLFTNAGMNQFKDAFLGHQDRGYRNACSSQKCVRAGGKHNDLDNVGYTARHHTFFEMLGNFSFGDYFKDRAIDLSWRFLTETLAIPTGKLYVTVYQDDDESYDLWRDQVGVPEERIFRFGKKDNFWAMGDTGPCGPCSEIFYDYGNAVPGPTDPYEAIASGSDRIVEIWNLVFMQFDNDGQGNLTPLPNPSIDTGMGLERIASVMQGCHSNYDTDLFRDLIEPVATAMNLRVGENDAWDTGLRVIADHLRAMAFLISDGVVPSNEGRGYVLRRIMRRAMRYGKQLGQTKPFLHNLTSVVLEKMGATYPELDKEQDQIELLVRVEEEAFDKTLTRGMPILTGYLKRFSDQKLKAVPGQVIHYMYGTLGFPVDLMEDIARDWGLTLNHAEYQQITAVEAEASQAGSDFTADKVHSALVTDAGQWKTEQTCHEGLNAKGMVRRLIDESGTDVSALPLGKAGDLVLDRTSFYAESGGQIGDKGFIRSQTGLFQVSETSMVLDKLVVHHGKVVEGTVQRDQEAKTEVLPDQRTATMKNHSATHLLHQALRDVLGLHVRQAGSLVDPEKLRFDFSHFEPMSKEQIEQVENLVNDKILLNMPVETQVLPQELARDSGAIAFFGEKYGDVVRVVGMGDFSKEFCGGTHVTATGEIGCFKITSEKGLASGIRRLVALTGPKALNRFQESETLLKQAQDKFFLNRETLMDQLQRMQDERKQLEQKIDHLKMQLAKGGGSQERTETLDGQTVILKQVSDVAGGQLRQLADELLGRIKSGTVLLGSDLGDKAQLIVKTNLKGVHAGKLVGSMASVVGGKGGGRPDMAMAGGKDVAKIAEALEQGLAFLKKST